METPQTKFQTSFVPKKPVIASQSNQFRKKTNLFLILAIIIFLATGAFAGGVYVFKLNVQKQIVGQQESLKKINERIDKAAVSRATKLNDKIVSVKSIIDNHISPSIIFELLEDETLKTVQFDSFSFVIDSQKTSDPQKKIIITATGVGADFDSIVLQSGRFGDTGVLKDVIFPVTQPNQVRSVDFTFQAKVDPKFILYSSNLKNRDTLDNKEEDDDKNTNNAPANNTATSTNNPSQ